MYIRVHMYLHKFFFPGINVMITILGDFRTLSVNKLPFFIKTNGMKKCSFVI
jgi:hypothetical protein